MKLCLYLLILFRTGCGNIRISIFNNDFMYFQADINEEKFKYLKTIYDSNGIKSTKLIITRVWDGIMCAM